MHEDYKKKLLNDLLENKYYDFKIELKDSFILDLKELEENSHITREDFKTEFSKLLHEVNISLMDNENQKKKNIIYEKYNDKYCINVNGHHFTFEFYFSKRDNKLNFNYFNKIIYSDKVVKIKELVIWFFELFCISILCKNVEIDMLLKSIVIFLMIVNFILFIVVICRQKYEKTIWVNEKSFDSYRKWIRCRNVSDLSRLYYVTCLLNQWIFCLFLLSIKSVVVEIMAILVIICVILYVNSINYLFKMYRLNVVSGGILMLVLVSIGYLNKDTWTLIALLFVILTQIFSEDIIYLSDEYSNKKRRKFEKYKDTPKGKEKIIKLKFKINIVILFCYMFIMICDKSRILVPLISIFVEEKLRNSIPCLLILAVERISILSLILMLLKSEISFVVKYRKKFIDKFQIIINYIAKNQFPI